MGDNQRSEQTTCKRIGRGGNIAGSGDPSKAPFRNDSELADVFGTNMESPVAPKTKR
jgi:hypothetical protein